MKKNQKYFCKKYSIHFYTDNELNDLIKNINLI